MKALVVGAYFLSPSKDPFASDIEPAYWSWNQDLVGEGKKYGENK
jgi:hypothetical protein